MYLGSVQLRGLTAREKGLKKDEKIKPDGRVRIDLSSKTTGAESSLGSRLNICSVESLHPRLKVRLARFDLTYLDSY